MSSNTCEKCLIVLSKAIRNSCDPKVHSQISYASRDRHVEIAKSDTLTGSMNQVSQPKAMGVMTCRFYQILGATNCDKSQILQEIYHEAFSRASDSSNAGITATAHPTKGFVLLLISLQVLLRLVATAKRLDRPESECWCGFRIRSINLT